MKLLTLTLIIVQYREHVQKREKQKILDHFFPTHHDVFNVHIIKQNGLNITKLLRAHKVVCQSNKTILRNLL